MGFKEDMIDLKCKVNEVKKYSENINNYSNMEKFNKRLYILCIILIFSLFCTVSYIIYITNDINTITEEYTQEVTSDGCESIINQIIDGKVK